MASGLNWIGYQMSFSRSCYRLWLYWTELYVGYRRLRATCDQSMTHATATRHFLADSHMREIRAHFGDASGAPVPPCGCANMSSIYRVKPSQTNLLATQGYLVTQGSR